MSQSAAMKEEMIKNYIKDIDFKRGDFSVKEMKAQLRTMLHEFPSIEIEYSKTESVNEVAGKKVIVEDVKSVTISYSDGTTDNNLPLMKKCKLYV